MFIRRTKTRSMDPGKGYFSYRLVQSERHAGRVRQRTLLNLGSHFPLERANWPLLCTRIEQLLSPQNSMLPATCPDTVESEAQRIAAQLVQRSPESTPQRDLHSVDVDSLEMVRPRSAGVEQVGLWAMQQCGFEAHPKQLGFNGPLRAMVLGSIVGRMAVPGSERATWKWLCTRSALGELIEVDYESLNRMRLYRASDALMARRQEIEDHLFGQVTELFSLQHTVTLFDLTNTYFEGTAAEQPKAKRGRSKEKRSDCPLLTLGLVLDGSGFVRRSEVFDGNVVEGTTRASMLSSLGAPSGALVVMDAGIATLDNLAWLREQEVQYLVVSRQGSRQFDADQATRIETRSGQPVHLQTVKDEKNQEMHLYGHSEEREKKEAGISERFVKRFEKALTDLHEGLSRPRTRKGVEYIWQRIGRIREKSRGIGQHDTIEVETDPNRGQATAVTWKQKPVDGTLLTHPGVYCLRTNLLDWDPEALWRTYTMLTDLEAVFRSLKSELGLRPIYHRTQHRSDGHLFITVIAYQLVQIIRRRLREQGETSSWATLRRVLEGQQRVTVTFRREDGRTVHVRKATRAEPEQLEIYRALGLDPVPGKTRKKVV